jgi:hypothetical protein
VGAAVQIPDADVGARLLYPDPYSIFQISPVLPPETQRIRLRAAAPEGAQSVTYTLNGETLATLTEPPYSYWWTLALGEYELTATATLADGAQQVSDARYFRVNKWEEPMSRTANAP